VPATDSLQVPPPPRVPASALRLRRRFRRFLAAELAGTTAFDRAASWDGFDPDFSRRMGAAGYIGLSLPRAFGGHGRPLLERYIVFEEALVAGAPVGCHWFADRQSGPLIARYGSEAQKAAILPRLCRGELCFCIGMSEPGAGSDLAALRTEARPVAGGFIANGTKLWTTNAHRADYMIALMRTTPRDAAAGRHAGFSQFLVDLRSAGIGIRPVRDLHGREHFNEVTFTDCFLPADAVIGKAGDGWAQVTAELALERSGPERYLSCHVLLTELLRVLRGARDTRARVALGRAVAELVTLRTLSLGVAAQLAAGEDPQLTAAVVKDLGARFEQSLPALAQELVAVQPTLDAHADDFRRVLGSLMLVVPSFSLRGGSVEVLRGIIARGLGLRSGEESRDG
jgi:alkylation response protein AidB-like acyl-CoA dehydrogenase